MPAETRLSPHVDLAAVDLEESWHRDAKRHQGVVTRCTAAWSPGCAGALGAVQAGGAGRAAAAGGAVAVAVACE